MSNFKKKLAIAVIIIGVFAFFTGIYNQDVNAAAKKKKGGLTQEQITTINTNLNSLTKKIYSNSLFSPQDNETMITIKLDLDDAMIKGASTEYAPLYFLEANLLKKRNYKTEAIECYQTIMENFSDTAFAPKARQELIKMGVKIEDTMLNKDEEEAEEE